MKSIVEEGSSVTKAIESAWSKAGKPKEFTVKVYEEQQKNFFGMTTHSAKVAIFFNEEVAKPIHQDNRKKVFNNEKPTNPFTWSSDAVEDVKISLKEIFDIIKIKNNFTTSINGSVLNINLEKPFCDTHELQKKVSFGFSYLLIQVLRNKHKKPFRGLKIIFHQ